MEQLVTQDKKHRAQEIINSVLMQVRDIRYKLPRSSLDELFPEFIVLLRKTLKQLLQIHHEFTYEELIHFLKRKKLDDFIRKKLTLLLEKLCGMEFKGQKITLSTFENLINDFEALLYEFQVSEGENNESIKDKIFGKKELSSHQLKELIDEAGIALEHKHYHDVEQLYMKIIQIYNLLSLQEKEKIDLTPDEIQILKQCRELNQQLFKGENLDAVYEEIETHEKQQEEKHRVMEEKHDQIVMQEEQVKEKEIIELNKASELLEKEKNMKRRELRLQQRESATKEQLSQLAAKEKELALLKEKITQFQKRNKAVEGSLLSTQETFADKETKIEQLENAITAKRKHIHELKQHILGKAHIPQKQYVRPKMPLPSPKQKDVVIYRQLLAKYKQLPLEERKKLYPELQKFFMKITPKATPLKEGMQPALKNMRSQIAHCRRLAQEKKKTQAKALYTQLLNTYKQASMPIRKQLFEDITALHQLLDGHHH
ncbi:hypothetical protein HZB01_05090 [Candidatus Woesearchaeota archaeon]|nr:hypothetical protein [Candidatus Woesearchaeota archaeon]